jgi:hypothetical protein
MTVVPADLVRDPRECLIGFVDLVRRLADIGITTRTSPLPPHEVADWHSDTHTLHLRVDATLDQQIWVLQQFWNYTAIGAHAAPAARRVAHLRLVPPQRDAVD